MVKEFEKGVAEKISESFVSTNFDCLCNDPSCQKTVIDTGLVDALEFLRSQVSGLWLTSGYRCARHNRLVGGKPGSFHLIGKAADVQAECPPADLAYIAEELVPAFKHGGIGVAKTFVHLDVRGYRSRWTY